MDQQIFIYNKPNSTGEIEVRIDRDTVWLSQYQLADLFETDRTSILKHVQNIYSTKELNKESTCAKIAQVRSEGNRKVKRSILHYNLDVIISVGYRVNSKKGTQFRIWATQRLKDYLVYGYAINKKRLEQKEMQVNHLKTGIHILSRALEEKANEQGHHWLLQYAKGLELLDDYDHEELDSFGKSKQPAVYPSISEYLELR